MKTRKCFLAITSSIVLFSVVCFLPHFMQVRAASADTEQKFVVNSTLTSKPTITTKAQFTSSKSIVVTGTAVANSTVTITGGLEDATGTVSNGSYSITVQLQINAVNTLQVKATDNGNVSAAANVKITQDSEAPATPTITTYPQTTNATSVKVTGVAEAGSTVTVTGGSAVATGTASGSGAYSILVKLNSNVLNTLSVTATDKAGNVSTAASIVVVQDSIVPDMPTIMTSSQTTTYTSIDVSGTAEAGSTVTITNGSVATTGIAIGGIYSIMVSLNKRTVNTLKVTATDMAGNVSAAATVIITQKSDSSATPDTVAPVKPTITTKAQTISATSITVTGTAEADSTVKITGGYGYGTVIGTASDSGGYSITVKLWNDTVNTLSVTATDAAGNVSGATTVKITQDSTAPVTPTIATPAQTTTSTSITVTGTAEVGSMVTITGGSATVTGTASSSGSYSIIEKLNPNAVNVLKVTATDIAGNVSTAVTVNITQEDAPATPTITTQEQSTTSTSITVTGTAKPGYIVTITGGAARAKGTVEDNGSYSISVSLNIGVENTLYVMQTDAAGFVSKAVNVNIMQSNVSSTPAIISYTMTADTKFTPNGTTKYFTVNVSRDMGSEALTDGNIMVVTTLATGDQTISVYSLKGDTTTQKITVDANSAKCSVYLINGIFDGTTIPSTYALTIFIAK